MSTTNTETPTIRSTYSDDQLRDALITATELRERIFIRGTVCADGAYGSQHWSEDQIEDLHAILNVLETLNEGSSDTDVDSAPTASRWVRAESIDEVRPGDEIKVETGGFVGVYGVPVERVGHDTKVIIFTSGDYFHWDDDFVVSRIPSPHPHPDYHPVVISAVGEAWVWDDADEHYIGVGSGAHRGPGDFGQGWVVGKVVKSDG